MYKMSKGGKKEQVIQRNQEKSWEEEVEEKRGDSKEEKKQQRAKRQRKQSWKNGKNFLENVKEEKEQEWQGKEKLLQEKDSTFIEALFIGERHLEGQETDLKEQEKRFFQEEEFFQEDCNRITNHLEKENIQNNPFFLQQKWIKQKDQKNEAFSIENLLEKGNNPSAEERIDEKETIFDKDINGKDFFTDKEQMLVKKPLDKEEQRFDYQNGRKEKVEQSLVSLSTEAENPLWIEQDAFIEKEEAVIKESIVEEQESFFQEEVFDTGKKEVPYRKQESRKKRNSFAKKEEFLEDLKKEIRSVKKEYSFCEKDTIFSKEEIVTMEQDFILAEEFISKPEPLTLLGSEVIFTEKSENLKKENYYFPSTRMVLKEEFFAVSKEKCTPVKEESSFLFLQENSIEEGKEKNVPEEESIFRKEKDLFEKEDRFVKEKHTASLKEKEKQKSDRQTKEGKRSFPQIKKKESIQKECLPEEKEEDVAVSKSKKWERQKKKVERAEARLERSKEKLPKQKEYHWERIFDEKSGTGKYVVRAVEKEKELRNPFLLEKTVRRLQGESRDWIHRKVGEVEKENAGVEAAHKSEQLLERTFGFVIEMPLSKQQKRKKRIERLEKKKRTAESFFLYQGYLEKHPELQKKVMQKQIQKKRIQREYAKNYRKRQAVKRKKEGWKKVDLSPEVIGKKIEKGKNRIAFLWMGGSILFFLLLFLMGISFCGALFGEMISVVLTGSYFSEPKEIDQLELHFTWMEMELQDRIDHIEEEYSEYQEYEYSLEEIGHNPFALVSYFSAKDFEFIANEKEQELEELFQESYALTLTPKIEIRTKMETETRFDPVTGMEWDEEVEVEYEVRILEVELNVISLEELAEERLDLEQRELFETYLETKGGLQQFASPLAMDWYQQISSFYGYRKHPITGQKQIHRGLDLAVAEGSPIYATHTGVVTTAAYHNGYGNYVVITDENGFLTKYAHLSRFYVAEGEEVEQGSLIGEAGSTGNSTGSHLHLEVMKDGVYYNPIFYFASGESIP